MSNDQDDKPPTPLVGERRRFRDAIERLRSHVDALADSVHHGLPTTSIRQSVTMTAVQATEHAAVIDALSRNNETPTKGN